MLKFAIMAGMFVVSVLLLVGLMFGFTKYKMYPVETFCENLAPSSTIASIIKEKKRQGLIILGEVSRTGTVSVLNQKSPFWRFACEVELENGRIVGKHVVAAD